MTRRAVLVGIGLLVLLLAALRIADAVTGEENVEWMEATVGDLVIGVPVEGTLASGDSSMLSPPQVEGFYDFQITFMAPEGEEVPEGTPVLAFDTAELERRLADSQTEAEEAAKNIEKLQADQRQALMDLELQLAEAQAQLRKARMAVDVPEDLASANELEQARLDLELATAREESLTEQIEAKRVAGAAQLEVLQGQKERAERQVRQIQDAIERMQVKAPRSGTVIYVTNWREEKKKVGDSAWRHERIIELPDLRTMMGMGEVDEADAGRVAAGQRFSLRLDAHPDIEYTGEVRSIWRTVQRKSFSRNPLKVVRLDLQFDETDVERMRPGMRFRGVIETERAEDVLRVPARAVFPAADGPVVYRSTLWGHEVVRVELGRRNDEWVEVVDGLREGDEVAGTVPGS